MPDFLNIFSLKQKMQDTSHKPQAARNKTRDSRIETIDHRPKTTDDLSCPYLVTLEGHVPPSPIFPRTFWRDAFHRVHFPRTLWRATFHRVRFPPIPTRQNQRSMVYSLLSIVLFPFAFCLLIHIPPSPFSPAHSGLPLMACGL